MTKDEAVKQRILCFRCNQDVGSAPNIEFCPHCRIRMPHYGIDPSKWPEQVPPPFSKWKDNMSTPNPSRMEKEE